MTIRITSVPLRGGDATLRIGNITIDPISSPRFDDFNNDNLLTADDLDLLSDAVRQNPLDLTFDVNGDSVVGGFDRVTWIRRIKHTTLWRRQFGPVFDSTDLVTAWPPASTRTTSQGIQLGAKATSGETANSTPATSCLRC